MIISGLILLLNLLFQPQSPPCGEMRMQALITSENRWAMSIQACAADYAALGTPEELAQTFETEIQAHNYFYQLVGRRYGGVLAPIPEG